MKKEVPWDLMVDPDQEEDYEEEEDVSYPGLEDDEDEDTRKTINSYIG